MSCPTCGPRTTCGYCGQTFDPIFSDAAQRFSFCSEEHQKLYRPGVAYATGLSCVGGVCETGELDFEPGDKQ